MLYFQFNTDKFIAPTRRVMITPYENGKPQQMLSYEENEEICLGDIETYFFNKLQNEVNITIAGFGNALFDIIGVPVGAFNIDDENKNDIDEIIKFVLSKYSEYPIQELDNKSLRDLGIEIEFCKKINNSELNKVLSEYMKTSNYEYVEEEVMWKNMTDDEKADVFSRNLNKIGSNNSELIIVDPYLFTTDALDYCNLLSKIIQKSNSKAVIVITDKCHCKNSSLQIVTNNVEASIDLKFSSDFHDRFWIANRTKGICSGTSLNGVGKRISLINEMADEDVKEVVEELVKQKLI